MFWSGDRKTSLDNGRTEHGPITIQPRPPAPWANTEHHSYSLITRQRNGFENPWESFHKPTLWEIAANASLKRAEGKVKAVDERDLAEKEEETVELVKKPNWGGPWNLHPEDDSTRIRASWLGHAGALIQFPPRATSDGDTPAVGINALVDPIFSDRSSPSKVAGPTRIVPSPCQVSDLPPIHLVFISHNQ